MSSMSYDSYSFGPNQPIPLMTINKTNQKTADGKIIGTLFNVTLESTLVAYPSGTGLVGITNLQDEIRNAFKEDGKLFSVDCDGNNIFTAYPRINAITFDRSSDNWVFTCPYTIELEFDEEPLGTGENSGTMPPYIREFSEDWSVEFVDDNSPFTWSVTGVQDSSPYHLRVTHNLSAVGKRVYAESGLIKEPWEYARDYISPLLGFDYTKLSPSGSLSLPTGDLVPYNHFRTSQLSETEGSFGISESWIVINTGGSGIAGRALETFDINVQESVDNAITSVNINGRIEGLETRSYGNGNPGEFSVTETPYEAASGYWLNVQSRLYGRASTAAGALTSGRSLNITPSNKSLGHNTFNGIITYNYTYNDRPALCVPGAISEVISINDTNPNDVFAQQVILGRAAGPILQDIGTTTARSRLLNIEILMQPPTGCLQSGVTTFMAQKPTGLEVIVDAVEADLTGTYSGVFKTQDVDSWNVTQGRYRRTVGWTFGNC